MTLLDFELHMRPVKVAAGRNMFMNDQVIELIADGEVWEATIRFGLYKVLVGVEDLKLSGSTCNCDARRTKYCEHAVAVLFAIRKKLNLRPILASTVPQIKYIDNRLENLLKSFTVSDYEVTDRDAFAFMAKTKKMLQLMEHAFKKQDFLRVASLGIAVITAYQKLDELLDYTYTELETCIQEAFDWLEKLYSLPVEDDLYSALFHDTRIEAVKGYQTVSNEGKNWMDLLLAGANNATRKDQFTRTMNALCILVGGSENKQEQKIYIEQFLNYRNRLKVDV